MPDISTIIVHLLNIAILYVILRYLLYKPVKGFMSERTARIAAELEKAKAMQEEADKVTGQAADILEQAREESRGIINLAAGKAKADADGIIAMAEEQAAEILRLAREDAIGEQAVIAQELQSQVGALALEIAGQILSREIRAEDNTAIINNFFADNSVFHLATRDQANQ